MCFCRTCNVFNMLQIAPIEINIERKDWRHCTRFAAAACSLLLALLLTLYYQRIKQIEWAGIQCCLNRNKLVGDGAFGTQRRAKTIVTNLKAYRIINSRNFSVLGLNRQPMKKNIETVAIFEWARLLPIRFDSVAAMLLIFTFDFELNGNLRKRYQQIVLYSEIQWEKFKFLSVFGGNDFKWRKKYVSQTRYKLQMAEVFPSKDQINSISFIFSFVN